MLLQRLRVDNFRNYQHQELLPAAEINLLCGANAQGKSNLLEAICYLGMACSFRGAADSELIRHGQQYFYLEAEADSAELGKLRLGAAFARDKKRKWTVNGQPKKRLSDVVGLLHTVVFAPEDIYLVKAGPEQRRRYLNRQMSQNEREFCRLLLNYNHVLKQRNACLKLGQEQDISAELDVWDKQLAAYGGAIIAGRQRTMQRLAPLAAELQGRLSGGEKLELEYQSPVAQKAGGELSADSAAEALAGELRRLRQAEIMRGLTLAGPHREDFIIRVDGQLARDFASQGQQRTLALALKLAELELARELSGEYPLLLLDDVLSELDQQRRRQIVRYVEGRTQTFISAVEGELEGVAAAAKWKVENGVCFLMG